ncbi:hypothetical protein JCM3775_004262 [Rhodotorula graminis]
MMQSTITLARRTALSSAPRLTARRTLATAPRDTSTYKQTIAGEIKPTAWNARKTAAREVGPVWAWPLLLITVGAGAVTLYFSSGKGKTELANNLEAPPSPFKVQK